jgi:two-component system cell cycle response regulator
MTENDNRQGQGSGNGKPAPSYRKRILIVDDDPTSLKLLSGILQKDEYEVLKATDGKEAIKAAFKKLPDVILLDVIMPTMDGFEVTRRLKADPRTKHIPIILVTCLDGMENKLTGLEAGAEEYLSKPIKPVELLARVKSMLQLKQYRDQLSIRKQSEGAFVAAASDEKLGQLSGEGLPVVLLVEDSEIDAKIIQSLLKDMPLRVETAWTGGEAISRIHSAKLDLILLDILLPDMTGFEICQRLKTTENNHDTPVIVITCLHDFESKITGAELGADDYLVKPVNKQELTARIKVLLEKKRQLDKLRAHYETALNSAIYDWLTGVFNHGYLKKFLDLEIKRSLRQSYPVCLLMIDIDDFKIYNDSLGHAAGDIILKELAQVAKNSTREVDLVCRYGGDEFSVVLPYADHEGSFKVAKRIEQAIHAHNFLQGQCEQLKRLTCSMGLAVFPSDALTVEELIRKADEMLYLAKQRGKDRICVCGENSLLSGFALSD